MNTPYPVRGLDEVTIFKQKAINRKKCVDKRKNIIANRTPEDELESRQIVLADDESSMYFIEQNTRKDPATDENSEWDAENNGMYTEIIKSKPISNGQDLKKTLSDNEVPNFSLTSTIVSSTQLLAPRDLPKHTNQSVKLREKHRSRCTTQESSSFTTKFSKSLLTLRNSLQILDDLIDKSQIPILIRYRTGVKVILILIITWQFSSLIDQSAYCITKLCGL